MTREKEIENTEKQETTDMLVALRKKHPKSELISIDKKHEDYIHMEGIVDAWSFYIAGTGCEHSLTWQELKDLVAKHLGDE